MAARTKAVLRRRRRATGEKGTALIEAAIILPVLAVIVFGIVECGFLYRTGSVVTGATRSGARIASAQYGEAQTNPDQNAVVSAIRGAVEQEFLDLGGTDTPVQMWIYRADTNGNPPPGDFSSCTSNCYVFTWNSGAKKFNNPSGSWSAPDACGKVIDSVGVWLQVTHVPIGFTSAFGTVSVKEKTVMRLEPRSSNPCLTPE